MMNSTYTNKGSVFAHQESCRICLDYQGYAGHAEYAGKDCPPKMPDRADKASVYVCNKCKSAWRAKKFVCGYLACDVILWLAFFFTLHGVVLTIAITHSLWRIFARRKGCANCGADMNQQVCRADINRPRIVERKQSKQNQGSNTKKRTFAEDARSMAIGGAAGYVVHSHLTQNDAESVSNIGEAAEEVDWSDLL